jgi:SAM-dependent methyltransferase
MLTIDFKKINSLRQLSGQDLQVLDIGCGQGRHLSALMKFPNAVAIGGDINLKDLLEAKIKLQHQTTLGECLGTWNLLRTSITQLPLKSNQFDLVICSEVLEHIRSHRAAVKELLRVLKADGILAVSVPRYLPERLCWWLSEAYYTSPGGHLRIYRQSDLIRLVKGAGADKMAIHHAHSLHAPYWWLKSLLGAKADKSKLVHLYHHLLVWDIMTKPKILAVLDRLLNPLIGKSLVIYFKKREGPALRATGNSSR